MSTAKSILARIDRWTTGTVDARALAVFRILTGFSVWFEGRENVERLQQYTADQFHLTYLGFEPGWSVEQLHALCEWQMRFAVGIVLGVFGRVFALAAFACQASLFLVSQLNFRNHIYFMLILLVLLAASRCDARWSLGALARKVIGRADRGARVPGLAARLVMFQVLFIYFYSGLHKLVLGFGNGYALCRFLGRELTRGRSADLLSETQLGWVAEHMSREACAEGAPGLIVFGSVATIVAEVFLAAGLAHRRTRWFAVVCGLGLHGTIFLAMDVVTFGLMMVATYPLFVTDPLFGASSADEDDADGGASSAGGPGG